MSGLRRRGDKELPAFHMVELLDASIRGLTARRFSTARAPFDVAPLTLHAPIMTLESCSEGDSMTGAREKESARRRRYAARRAPHGRAIADLPENFGPSTSKKFTPSRTASPQASATSAAGRSARQPEATPMYAPMPAPGSPPAAAPGRPRGVFAASKQRSPSSSAKIFRHAPPYTRDEVLAAMASCHPAIEVLETAFVDPAQPTAIRQLADLQMHGGFIYGPAFRTGATPISTRKKSRSPSTAASA